MSDLIKALSSKGQPNATFQALERLVNDTVYQIQMQL